MRKKTQGHLFAILTIFIWSSSFIVSKLLLESVTPLQLLYVRYGITLVFLIIIHPHFEKIRPLKEELLFFAIGAALAGYFIFENSALQHTYSSNVSLIDATIPLLTGLLSIVFFKIPFFTLRNTVGLILAYGGVVIIILNGRQFEGANPFGDLLALGGAIMFAFYSVLIQKIEHPPSIIQLTRKIFFYGFIVLTFFIFSQHISYNTVSITLPLIGGVLFLAIISSSLAFILWNQAIRIIGSTHTSQYIYLVPVITTIFSAFILKEHITLLTLVGTAFILLGLYLSEQ